MKWRDYEMEVHATLLDMFPGARITHDATIVGRYSKTPRQIDVLIEADVAGFSSRIVVDAKNFSRRVDIGCVEASIAKLDDVSATHGLLVTQIGYSKGAINRACCGPTDIELDILNFEDLTQFQGLGAIPYAGGRGLLVPAPFGWVIDGTQACNWVSAFYQRGRTLQEAAQNREWMYLNFWAKETATASAEQLVEYQNKQMNAAYESVNVSLQEGPARSDGKHTLIRTATSDELPCTEITGYIDFDDFIPFFVLFTIPELASKNMRKLKHVLSASLPIHVSFQDVKIARHRSDI